MSWCCALAEGRISQHGFGHQVGAGRSLGALMLGRTWLVSAISGSIAVGSCVLNDFFDYAVDSINDPNKVTYCPICCKHGKLSGLRGQGTNDMSCSITSKLCACTCAAPATRLGPSGWCPAAELLPVQLRPHLCLRPGAPQASPSHTPPSRSSRVLDFGGATCIMC